MIRIFCILSLMAAISCTPVETVGRGASGTEVTVLDRIPAASPGSASFAARFQTFRSARGLPAVRTDSRLTAAARRHAADMARNGFFAHRGSDGTKPSDRVKRAGFSPCYTAENLGKGSFSEAQIFSAWENSPSHRRLMQNRRVTRYGLAQNSGNWVLVMAQPQPC